MSKRDDEQDGSPAAGTSRRQRLAAALRDNLAKRKAQSRARHSAAVAGDGADASAGAVTAGNSNSGDDPPASGP